MIFPSAPGQSAKLSRIPNPQQGGLRFTAYSAPASSASTASAVVRSGVFVQDDIVRIPNAKKLDIKARIVTFMMLLVAFIIALFYLIAVTMIITLNAS